MSRRYFTIAERKYIKKRAKSRCEYCQILQGFSPQKFHNEHVEPVSKNGTNDLENMAFACGGCNSVKSDRVEGYDSYTQKKFHYTTLENKNGKIILSGMKTIRLSLELRQQVELQ